MNPDKKCEFCKISSRTRIFYSDDEIIGFLAKDAIGPGQSLVIPRRHIEDISDLPYDTVCRIFNLCKVLSTVLIKVFQANGVNIICNNGRNAGQVISHLHVHVVPRFKGDVTSPSLWLNQELYERLYQPTANDFKEMASKMKEGIASLGTTCEK
ncbi:MAG: HIT family protein [Candidatus Bathyarchaeia archaeon]|jgi:histidine triad (HIT) family protein